MKIGETTSDMIGSARPDSGLGLARRQAVGLGSKAIKLARGSVDSSNPTDPMADNPTTLQS
jgi:hypothetical protein